MDQPDAGRECIKLLFTSEDDYALAGCLILLAYKSNKYNKN